MLKTLKRFLVSFSVLGLFLAPTLAIAGTAYAQNADCNSSSVNIEGCAGTGACLNTQTANCDAQAGDANTRVNNIITTTINIFSLVVGVVSVIMIIIGGLKYITSSGDSGNVTGAKNTILYAIIGLVVVVLAQVIVRFVLGKVTAP